MNTTSVHMNANTQNISVHIFIFRITCNKYEHGKNCWWIFSGKLLTVWDIGQSVGQSVGYYATRVKSKKIPALDDQFWVIRQYLHHHYHYHHKEGAWMSQCHKFISCHGFINGFHTESTICKAVPYGGCYTTCLSKQNQFNRCKCFCFFFRYLKSDMPFLNCPTLETTCQQVDTFSCDY